MTERTVRVVERALLRAGGDLDDLLSTLASTRARRVHRPGDVRMNAIAHVQACVARIEFCTAALRRERRRKL